MREACAVGRAHAMLLPATYCCADLQLWRLKVHYR